jgi:hypothetical protein
MRNSIIVEDTKAEIGERHRVNNLEYLTIETIAGDVFEITQPQVRICLQHCVH